MNEKIIQFFGTTWKNVVIRIIFGFVLLFIITFLIAITGPDVAEWSYGWPLPFLDVNEDIGWDPSFFHPVYLILDSLFWYLIISLIIFTYNKIRKN